MTRPSRNARYEWESSQNQVKVFTTAISLSTQKAADPIAPCADPPRGQRQSDAWQRVRGNGQSSVDAPQAWGEYTKSKHHYLSQDVKILV